MSEVERERDALREEVAALRVELAELRKARATPTRGRRAASLLRPWRLLIPLFDRHHVVRSFSSLMTTLSGYSQPQSEWPTRDAILGDTRVFLEAVARFQATRSVAGWISDPRRWRIGGRWRPIHPPALARRRGIMEKDRGWARGTAFAVVSGRGHPPPTHAAGHDVLRDASDDAAALRADAG